MATPENNYSNFCTIFFIAWLSISIFLSLFHLIVLIFHVIHRAIKYVIEKVAIGNYGADNINKRLSEISLKKYCNERFYRLFSFFSSAYDLNINFIDFWRQAPEGKNFEALRVFDFLKVASCLIIIFYHSSNLRSPLSQMPKETTLTFEIIYDMGQIVDVFFWISGILNFLSLSRRFNQIFKENNVKFVPIFFELVWGRFIRVYAPYLFSLLYMTSIHWRIFENNTKDEFMYGDLAKNTNCWKNMFMVANHKCMQFSWYMADDLILYALLVVVVYIPFKINQKYFIVSKFKSRFMIFFSMFGSLLLAQLCSFFILRENQFSFSDYFPSLYPMPTCFPKMNKQYFFFFFTISPVTRFSSFIFGGIIGLAFEIYSSEQLKEKIYEKIKEKKSSWKKIIYFSVFLLVIGIYFLGFFIIKSVFTIAEPVQYQADLWTRAQHYQYLLWWRLVFLIGLTFFILPCLASVPFDFLGVMLKIRWPFTILAKLTYCAYLFHIYAIELSIFIYGKKNDTSPEKFLFETYVFDVLMSFTIALVIYLLVEVPIRNILSPKKNNKSIICNEESQKKSVSSKAEKEIGNTYSKPNEEEKNNAIINEGSKTIELNTNEHESKMADNHFSEDIFNINNSEKKILNIGIKLRQKIYNVVFFFKNQYNKYFAASKIVFFILSFIVFVLALHHEIYSELYKNKNEIWNCNFSPLQNASNCTNSTSNSSKVSRIYLDTVYGVCVDECRNDRFLFTLENKCVVKCPSPYLPSLEEKHCCSPLCQSCNISAIDQCFTCRFSSYLGICLKECPIGTILNPSKVCISCKETNYTHYYDVKNKSCLEMCDGNKVIDIEKKYCLEKCPDDMHKSSTGNHCCDKNCEDCTPNSSKECTQCSGNTPYFYDKTCVSHCPNILKSDNKTCVSCMNKTPFYNYELEKCVEKCPDNLQVFARDKICVKNCSNYNPAYWNAKNNTCCKLGCDECSILNDSICTNCSKDYLFFPNQSQCLLSCPIGYAHNVTNNACIRCPNGTDYCDRTSLAKWCSPNFLLFGSNCKGYCPNATPDPSLRFCCNDTSAKCPDKHVCSRLKLDKVYSSKMQRYIPFFILLPVIWEKPTNSTNSTFPVVMIFHANYASFSEQSLQINFGCYNENYLLVFPDGDLNSYFSDCPNDPRTKFETFIVEELRPFLIENYRADNERKWASIGISSGGFGSLALTIKHKDKFCASASLGAPLTLIDFPSPKHDVYMEYRFGNKTTMKDNYIPFNITWLMEKTDLQNNEVNIYFSRYKKDFVYGNDSSAVNFFNYLKFKGINHTNDEVDGTQHITNWEKFVINKYLPFFVSSFNRSCV